jgi:hypothetical protein
MLKFIFRLELFGYHFRKKKRRFFSLFRSPDIKEAEERFDSLLRTVPVFLGKCPRILYSKITFKNSAHMILLIFCASDLLFSLQKQDRSCTVKEASRKSVMPPGKLPKSSTLIHIIIWCCVLAPL